MNELRCAYPNELYHHGILGQKWGIRRYQNEDGSLTTAGRKRYTNEFVRELKKNRDTSNSRLVEAISNDPRIKESEQRFNKIANKHDPLNDPKVQKEGDELFEAMFGRKPDLSNEKDNAMIETCRLTVARDVPDSAAVTRAWNYLDAVYDKVISEYTGSHGLKNVKIKDKYGSTRNINDSVRISLIERKVH